MPTALSCSPAKGSDTLMHTSTFAKDDLENLDDGEYKRPSILTKVILDNPESNGEDTDAQRILAEVNMENSNDEVSNPSSPLSPEDMETSNDVQFMLPIDVMDNSNDRVNASPSLLSQVNIEKHNSPFKLSYANNDKPDYGAKNTPLILTKVSMKNSDDEAARDSPSIFTQVNTEKSDDGAINRPVLCSFPDRSNTLRRTQSATPTISPLTLRKNRRAELRLQRLKAMSSRTAPFSDETMGFMVDPFEEYPEGTDSEGLVYRFKRACGRAWFNIISYPFDKSVEEYYAKSPRFTRSASRVNSEESYRRETLWESVQRAKAAKQNPAQSVPCRSEPADRRAPKHLNRKTPEPPKHGKRSPNLRKRKHEKKKGEPENRRRKSPVLRKRERENKNGEHDKHERESSALRKRENEQKKDEPENREKGSPVLRKRENEQEKVQPDSTKLSPIIERPSVPPFSSLGCPKQQPLVTLEPVSSSPKTQPMTFSVTQVSRNPHSPPAVRLNVQERSSSNVRVSYDHKRAADTAAMWVSTPPVPKKKKKKFKVYDDM